MKVILQFGDGTSKEIDMGDTYDKEPETAVEDAKEWILDNAWLEVQDEEGNNVAEIHLR